MLNYFKGIISAAMCLAAINAATAQVTERYFSITENGWTVHQLSTSCAASQEFENKQTLIMKHDWHSGDLIVMFVGYADKAFEQWKNTRAPLEFRLIGEGLQKAHFVGDGKILITEDQAEEDKVQYIIGMNIDEESQMDAFANFSVAKELHSIFQGKTVGKFNLVGSSEAIRLMIRCSSRSQLDPKSNPFGR